MQQVLEYFSENRIRSVGEALGAALDADELPVTRVARQRRIPADAPPPLVVWGPSRWQWFCRNLRRRLGEWMLPHGR